MTTHNNSPSVAADARRAEAFHRRPVSRLTPPPPLRAFLLAASLLLCVSAFSAPSQGPTFASPPFSPLSPVQRPFPFLAEVAAPSASALGSWLLSAAGALSIVALAKQFMRKTPIEAEFLTKKEFDEFRDKVDTNFNSLRDRIDHSHEALATKLDNINTRLADVTSLVARLDERTRLNAPRSADLQSAVSQACSLHPQRKNQERET